MVNVLMIVGTILGSIWFLFRNKLV